MSIPSFQRFDYLLRTNKSIERKLVFDVVLSAQKEFSLTNLWYLGFGSMWFGDFKIAHRTVGIDDMISIEHEDHAPRAEFNRPFSKIKVIPGESNDVIKKNISNDFWGRPVVAWLDYDGCLSPSVVDDIDSLLSKSTRDSILIFTVNGARGSYRPKPTGLSPSAPTSGIQVLAEFLGNNAIPKEQMHRLPLNASDPPEAEFPKVLGQSLLNYLWHKMVGLARDDEDGPLGFLPLFLMHHRDGVDMVTIGGAVVSESERTEWQDMFKAHPVLSDGHGNAKYCVMNLAPVTLREKITLDRFLPDSGDADAYRIAVENEGVKLPIEEVEKYRQFYRQFPVFLETTY